MSEYNAKFDVLIIDDEKEVCEILKLYCEDLGFFRHVITCNNAIQAIYKMKNQKFCLILLDVNMPNKDGIALLDNIASYDIPLENVCLVSGELDSSKLVVAMEKGVKNFIVKPFDEDTFLEKVTPMISKLTQKRAS